MFLNYLQLNFIRFFKGRSAIITALFELVIVALTMLPLIAVYLLDTNVEVSDDVNPTEVYYFATQVIILLPVVIGLVGTSFICTYYTYRSYYNLEVGMRNRILFCLSELFTLYAMCGIILVVFYFCLGIIEIITYKSGQSMFFGGPIYTVSMAISVFCLMADQAMNAFFIAKLIRRRGLSFLLFMIVVIFTFIISALIPNKYELVRCAILPTFVTWFSHDTPMFMQEDKLYIICGVCGFVLKNVALFAMSVMAFNRKQEERHK